MHRSVSGPLLVIAALVSMWSSTTHAQTTGGNKRLLCGCASSRFLARGTVVVGENTLGAWLHGDTQIDGYAQQDGSPTLSPTSLPFQVTPDERGTGGASRLVKIRATDKGEGLLGIVRVGDKAPRDVLRSTFTPSSPASASSTTAPVVTALWLEPVELRDRRDCGQYLTQRLAYELAPGSAAIEGFVVTDLDDNVSTLVDARHVGAFGIGHVDVCDHGATIKNAPSRVSITPIAALGAAAEAWSFSHDGTGTTPTQRLSSPSTADGDRIALPFPTPGEPTQPMSWRSVGGLWIIGTITGVVAALLAFIAWKLKKRRIQEIRCASCGGTVPVDVLDKKTDGFFCPHCGTAGYWKGSGVDVSSTPL